MEDGGMYDFNLVSQQVIGFIPHGILGITQKLCRVTMLPQLPCSKVLGVMYKHVREPNLHVGHIWFSPKEGLKRGFVACPGANSPIHGIDDGCECIHPEEVGGVGVFHYCPTLVKDSPVHPLCDTILLWCVRHCKFE